MRRWALILVAVTVGCAVVMAIRQNPELYRQTWSCSGGRNGTEPGSIDQVDTLLLGTVLEPDSVIERELAAGELHVYSMVLERQTFARVVLRQQGIDIAATLFDPLGKRLLLIDTPNGLDGPEPLAIVADTKGAHRLELQAANAGVAGRYKLEVEEFRPAGEKDRNLARAMQAFAEGDLLRTAKDVESRRDSLERFREALSLWPALEAPRLQALTLRRMGQIAYSLGEIRSAVEHFSGSLALYPAYGNDREMVALFNDAGSAYRLAGEPEKALACFERALEISRRQGFRSAMAVALNNLGMLHDSIGKPQQALSFYDRALTEWQKVGRPIQEATTLHNLGVSYASLGKTEEGLDFLERSLHKWRTHEDSRGQGAALTALGWVHFLEGDFEAALAACGESHAIAA